MPQTVNEPGNAGFFDINTGEMKVAGVGGIGLDGDIENKINIAPRLGITYQLNEKTVIRMGYGRSYDIGVFGSTFGHSVTQNLPVLARQTLNAPQNFESIFNLAQGPPPPTFPAVGRERPLPGARRRQPLDPARAAEAALRGRLEPDRPARADARRSRPRSPTSATRGRTCSTGTAPTSTSTSRPRRASPTCPRNERRPFFNGPGGRLRRALRPDHGHALPVQLLRQQLQLAAGQADQALHAAATRCSRPTRCSGCGTTAATSTSSTATSSTARRSGPARTSFTLAATSSCRSARASGT